MSAVATLEAPTTRRPGRPSKAAPFRELVAQTLVARPETRTLALFEAAKVNGYAGAKSALYALVASLRREIGVQSAAETIARARVEKKALRVQRRADKAAQREQWALENVDRKRRRTEERQALQTQRIDAHQQRQAQREMVRAERAAAAGKPSLEYVRPLAADEESNRLRVLGRKWINSREATHKTNVDDRSRWRLHVAPAFGDLRPGDVDAATLRAFIEEKLAAGLISTTVRNCMALLSSLFTDLIEQGLVERNPVAMLSRAVKRLYRRAHDPRTTPFLERMEDIDRLRSALVEPVRTMFSVGVMSGLRSGELAALEWSDLRSDLRVIHVQRRLRNGKINTPKSGHGRVVPTSPALREVLAAWKERTGGGVGPVFKPPGDAKYIDMGGRTFRSAWQAGLERAGIPRMKFYCATRHTYASQWVMAGNSIEKLSKLLGHSSVVVTEIYAHLKPESMIVPDVISFTRRVEYPTGDAAVEGRAA
jgi:integrase